jgi:hypothetical protein
LQPAPVLLCITFSHVFQYFDDVLLHSWSPRELVPGAPEVGVEVARLPPTSAKKRHILDLNSSGRHFGVSRSQLQTRPESGASSEVVVYSPSKRAGGRDTAGTLWKIIFMLLRTTLGRRTGCGGAAPRGRGSAEHSKAAKGQHSPAQPLEDHTD